MSGANTDLMQIAAEDAGTLRAMLREALYGPRDTINLKAMLDIVESALADHERIRGRADGPTTEAN